MMRSLQRLDINIEELDRLLDRAREEPLSDAEREKLRTALHVLAGKFRRAAVPPRRPGPLWTSRSWVKLVRT